jgi:hypothetical protein
MHILGIVGFAAAPAAGAGAWAHVVPANPSASAKRELFSHFFIPSNERLSNRPLRGEADAGASDLSHDARYFFMTGYPAFIQSSILRDISNYLVWPVLAVRSWAMRRRTVARGSSTL